MRAEKIGDIQLDKDTSADRDSVPDDDLASLMCELQRHTQLRRLIDHGHGTLRLVRDVFENVLFPRFFLERLCHAAVVELVVLVRCERNAWVYAYFLGVESQGLVVSRIARATVSIARCHACGAYAAILKDMTALCEIESDRKSVV